MDPEILVIDKRARTEPGPIETRLREEGACCATLFLDDVLQAATTVSYRVGASQGATIRCADGRTGEPLSTARVKSVWAEAAGLGPNPMTFYHEDRSLSSTLRSIGLGEAWLMGGSVIATLSRQCLFLPQLMERTRANHRLYQMAAARDAGFSLPQTYVGTGFQEIRDLLRDGRDGDRRIHYQPLSHTTFSLWGNRFITVDRWLDADRTFALANVRGPAVFSRWPAYRRRLFAALLGEELWALEVDLLDPEVDPDVTDLFYQRAQDNLRLTPVELPAAAREACFRFARATGLVYTTLELLEEEEPGAYCFLAAHPDGRLHLFDEAGLPVYDHLVSWLRRGRA